MKRHELQTGEIERIGKRLIGANTLSEAEIDAIVAQQFLYSSIRANMAGEKVRSSLASRYRYVAAFASLFIVLGVAAAAFLSRSAAPTQAVHNETVAPVPVQKFTEPDHIAVDSITTHDAVLPEPRRTVPTAQNASYRKPGNVRSKSRKTETEPRPDLEFYPLTYAGDPSDMARGGRIIRVEMSRASLFAMGVNLPIENGAELVKADILVGSDGIPRAIRMPQ